MDPEHIDILRQGVEVWNTWRDESRVVSPDLSYADLGGASLSGFSLWGVNLQGANLMNANLARADLTSVDLGGANLVNANLSKADLKGADFTRADPMSGDFFLAKIRGANLNNSDFSGVRLAATSFINVDLSGVKGLDAVLHRGPSEISISTIYRSGGNIPEVFLRGAGLDDTFITYIRSLVIKPIEYYTCFISYSSKDQAFAERLYADLQSKNVLCWYAPEDLKIGDKFRVRIDESIQLYDKLLLVLSEDSLASNWVAYEVEKALNKEPEGTPNGLFPIRLDKTILTCETDWAKDIRKSRHIGDFEDWKDHDAYQRAFQRLLRDLKAQS